MYGWTVSFGAGATPFAEENDCLWIVDYKTTAHGGVDVEEFLAKERTKYAPQMEAYASGYERREGGALLSDAAKTRLVDAGVVNRPSLLVLCDERRSRVPRR